MEPGNRPFNNPSGHAQPAPMRSAPFCDLSGYALCLERLTDGFAVVATICLNAARFAQWATRLAVDWRKAIEQGQQLRDIVSIGLRQDDIYRKTLRVDEEVVFAARFTAIGWVRSSFFPPWTARIDELSTMTRLKSSLSAPRSLASNTACSRFQTPAFCHARNRRQQVMPEPQPISWGSISQGIPDCSTKRIPVNTRRLSSGLRPGFRFRRRFAGSNGSINDHNSSSTSSRTAIPRRNNLLRSIIAVYSSFC